MEQGKKGDVEFVIAGDDNVTQVLKSIVEQLQNVKQQANQVGRQMDSSFDRSADSSRRTGEAVRTVSDRLREIGDGVTHIKKLTVELERTEDSAKDASREMQRGFQESGRAADQAANRISHLKQRISEVAISMRGLMDSINNGTAGFQSFVGDQLRRGAYVGALAVTGFAAHSVKKDIDINYEFAQLGSTLKSGYYKNGKFDEKSFNQDFSKLKEEIKAQGLRPDREPGTIDVIEIAKEMAKNNMNPQAISAALSVISDFAQANGGKGGITPDQAAKYLANKLEAAKMAYTPANFQKVADQFTKTVDMSSLDPIDVLNAEQYTDFANAMGNVDYAITQAMQVMLSKISVDNSQAGTSLRTLFLESNKFNVTDSELKNASSDKVRDAVKGMLDELNKVNMTVERDNKIPVDQKGNAKILRKVDVLSKYLSGLTSDQQTEIGEMLFGKEAASVITMFTPEGRTQLRGTINAIRNSQGITKRYADDRANTDKGNLVALGKAIDKIQMDVGDSLQPLLEATTKQLTDLATTGKFSFDEINRGVEESADLLSKKLNPEVAQLFEDLSKMATNGFQVGITLTPLAEGMGKSLIKLLNGDVSGAAKEVVLAINATDLKIENLPGELQGLATAAKNAAIFLAALAGLNMAVKTGENAKKIWDAGQKVGEVIRGKKIIEGTSLGGMEQTIRANVVNVYGSNVIDKGAPKSGGSTPVTTEISPSNETIPEKNKTSTSSKIEKAMKYGGPAILIAEMLGLTDYMSEDMKKITNDVANVAILNSLLGNPLKAIFDKLPAGSALPLTGTALIGAGWGYGLHKTEQYVNQKQKEDYHNKYDPVGADIWFDAQSAKKLQPANTPEGYISGQYGKDVAGVIDYLVKNKDSNSSIYLKGFSEDLLNEAIKNAQNNTRRMFKGIGDSSIEEYLDNRFRAYVAKYNKPKEEVQYERLRKADGENLFKDKMTELIVNTPTNTAVTSLLQQFNPILGALTQVLQQPVKVESQSNNTITIVNKTPMDILATFDESVSAYAQRTHNQRTTTPMQAVKMKQLE